MKLKRTTVKCNCCGKIRQEEVEISQFVSLGYIDGKPLGTSYLKKIYECPFCHYLSYDSSSVPSDEQKEIIASEEYRKQTFSRTKDERYVRLFMLCENDFDRVDVLFQWCWFWEFQGDNERSRNLRKRANNMLVGTLKQTPFVEKAIALLDSMRQMGEHLACRELVDSLSDVMAENEEVFPELYSCFVLEKQLLERGDRRPHIWGKENM